MKILRTPDACFEGIAAIAPHYTTIKTADGSGCIHHLDGATPTHQSCCVHGQPVWSYLYRKMIPLLVADGFRSSHRIYQAMIGQTSRPRGLQLQPASRLDERLVTDQRLSGTAFFGQDWGGLIGLRMIADNDERFERVVVSNTGLPTTQTPPTMS